MQLVDGINELKAVLVRISQFLMNRFDYWNRDNLNTFNFFNGFTLFYFRLLLLLFFWLFNNLNFLYLNLNLLNFLLFEICLILLTWLLPLGSFLGLFLFLYLCNWDSFRRFFYFMGHFGFKSIILF